MKRTTGWIEAERLRAFLRQLRKLDPTARVLNPIHDEIEIVCAPDKREAILALLKATLDSSD